MTWIAYGNSHHLAYAGEYKVHKVINSSDYLCVYIYIKYHILSFNRQWVVLVHGKLLSFQPGSYWEPWTELWTRARTFIPIPVGTGSEHTAFLRASLPTPDSESSGTRFVWNWKVLISPSVSFTELRWFVCLFQWIVPIGLSVLLKGTGLSVCFTESCWFVYFNKMCWFFCLHVLLKAADCLFY